jgi:hypothetical protein
MLLYPENTKLTDKNPGVCKCCVLLPKCAKTHVHASVISKIFPGIIPRTPLTKEWGKMGGKGKGRIRVRERKGDREGREGKKGWKGKEEEVIERRRVGKNLGSADFQTWERREKLKRGQIAPSSQGYWTFLRAAANIQDLL